MAEVGNVTGSNAVNVFLGLGLPFTLGSLYWSSVPGLRSASIIVLADNKAFFVDCWNPKLDLTPT